MESRKAIQLIDLNVCFNGRTVLNQLSCSIDAGEKVALTGRSGSGKSTILKCILGFVPLADGVIYIDGERLTARNVWQLRRKIAYVGQEPELGEGTVNELLRRPFSYRANALLKGNLDRVPSLLERFSLPSSIQESKIGTLSGGEKQRIAIIAAELLERKIYLLDEISSALDDEVRRKVAEFFRQREDITVLMISHDLDKFNIAERIVRIDGGGI